MLKKKLLLICSCAVLLAACVSDPTPNTSTTDVDNSQQIEDCDTMEAPVQVSAAKCTVNVYVENSVSMDGYVKPSYDNSRRR